MCVLFFRSPWAQKSCQQKWPTWRVWWRTWTPSRSKSLNASVPTISTPSSPVVVTTTPAKHTHTRRGWHLSHHTHCHPLCSLIGATQQHCQHCPRTVCVSRGACVQWGVTVAGRSKQDNCHRFVQWPGRSKQDNCHRFVQWPGQSKQDNCHRFVQWPGRSKQDNCHCFVQWPGQSKQDNYHRFVQCPGQSKQDNYHRFVQWQGGQGRTAIIALSALHFSISGVRCCCCCYCCWQDHLHTSILTGTVGQWDTASINDYWQVVC